MPRYTALLSFTQVSKAKVTVTAKDERAATRQASRIEAADVEDWDPVDGFVDVVAIRLARPARQPGKTRRKVTG